MPKKNVDCMFCAPNPCTCLDSPKSKKKPSVNTGRVREKSAKPTLPSVTSEPVTEVEFGPIPEPAKPKFRVIPTQRNLSYENVLLTVRDLVSARDQAWIDSELERSYPPEVDRRVVEWRKAHDGTVQ